MPEIHAALVAINNFVVGVAAWTVETVKWGPFLDWAVVVLPTLLAVAAVIMTTLRLETAISRNAWRSGVIFFGILVSVITWEQQRLAREAANPPLPDVMLSFVYSEHPALILFNNSDATAREIKWTLLLWNLDVPRAYSAGTHPPDADEPLQIPVSMFDFLRPHTMGGPQNIFDGPLVKPYVTDGNRFFGSASVTCPSCLRGYTYIVFIVLGKNGWFWQVPDDKRGSPYFPDHLTVPKVTAFYENAMATIPKSERIPIQDHP